MITYLKGDATSPTDKVSGGKVIAHVCNNIGLWGAGFVLAVSKKWEQPEIEFRKKRGTLGDVNFIGVATDIIVANMIAQNGVYNKYKNPQPLCYNSLSLCLDKVYEVAAESGYTIHMPKIGAGLARGNWNTIEKIIEDISTKYGVDTFIYTLD